VLGPRVLAFQPERPRRRSEAELREILRKEASPERIELEFERVMKEVRGAR
jgi:hypothetical protein